MNKDDIFGNVVLSNESELRQASESIIGRAELQSGIGICALAYQSCNGARIQGIFERVCSRNYEGCSCRQQRVIIPEGVNPLKYLLKGGQA